MLVENGAYIARRAADIIDERGHMQNGFYGDDGSVCTHSAINIAQGVLKRSEYSEYHAFHDEYGDWLIEQTDLGICEFNNTHTAEQVKAKLREYADSLE